VLKPEHRATSRNTPQICVLIIQVDVRYERLCIIEAVISYRPRRVRKMDYITEHKE
jgi:hypothetical protein